MDASFIPVEVVPSKTPFGLDQLRRSYKTALSAEDAIAAAPAVGAADEVFPCMFLMPISTPEIAEIATRIDLLYMGTIAFTGTGIEGDPFLPVLPAQKHDFGNAVETATGSRGVDGTILTSPITVEFYAPSTALSFFSFGGKGAAGTVADPTDEIQVRKVIVGDTAYAPTGALANVVANFFSPLITDTMDSPEIVPGQYWQNTERKTKTLSPWIFSVSSGNYIVMYSPGSGYSVGNSLTITDGTFSAVIAVASLGIGNSVVGFTVTSNTFNYDTRGIGPLYASGGSGSGAGFYNIHIA